MGDGARDGERRSLADAVVEAVAASLERDPETLPPLYEAVDPDALDALFGPSGPATRSGARGRVRFAYAERRVTVASDGAVAVGSKASGDAAESTPDADPASEAAFEDALAALVRAAESNGVDVAGGWACRDGWRPEWGIEIYEVR